MASSVARSVSVCSSSQRSQAALELAIVKLEARFTGNTPAEISDEDLAHALDARVYKVTEFRWC